MKNITTKNNIKKQYNSFANRFNKLHRDLDQVTNACYYPRFTGLRDKSILDIGCGEGKDLKYFQAEGAKISGIDISEKMVSLASAKLPDANIKLGSFEKIPFAKNSFDIVASKYSIQTTGSINKLYQELRRVLKKRGMAVITITHPIRQFMEKKKNKKDYFKKEVVESILFHGRLSVREESHTLLEYLSPFLFQNFELVDFDEKFDPSNAEMVNGDSYPAFMIIKIIKK